MEKQVPKIQFTKRRKILKINFVKFLYLASCICILNFSIFIKITRGYQSDLEESLFSIQAGTLELEIHSPKDNFRPTKRAVDLKPGKRLTRDIYVKNSGSLPISYNLRVSRHNTCNTALFKTLELEIYYKFYKRKNSDHHDYRKNLSTIELYDGKLADLELEEAVMHSEHLQLPNKHSYLKNERYAKNEHWLEFKIRLPKKIDSDLQTKSCSFDFEFYAQQQTEDKVIEAGFWDVATIPNLIKTGDWTAPTQIDQGIFFKGHNSEKENEISCGGYTNSENVRFSWTTPSDTDIKYYWLGTNKANKQKRIMASQSFYDLVLNPNNNPNYYTIIAVDKAGNQSAISKTCQLPSLDQVAPMPSLENLSTLSTISGKMDIRASLFDESPVNYFISIAHITGINILNSKENHSLESFSDQSIFEWDTVTVPDGTYIVTLHATDFAKNQASASVNIEVRNYNIGANPENEYFSGIKMPLENTQLEDNHQEEQKTMATGASPEFQISNKSTKEEIFSEREN